MPRLPPITRSYSHVINRRAGVAAVRSAPRFRGIATAPQKLILRRESLQRWFALAEAFELPLQLQKLLIRERLKID